MSKHFSADQGRAPTGAVQRALDSYEVQLICSPGGKNETVQSSPVNQGSRTLFHKVAVSMLGFGGPESAATTQLWRCGVKVALEKTRMNVAVFQ